MIHLDTNYLIGLVIWAAFAYALIREAKGLIKGASVPDNGARPVVAP